MKKRRKGPVLPTKQLTYGERIALLEEQTNNQWAMITAQNELLELAMNLLEALGADLVPEEKLKEVMDESIKEAT